MPHGARLLLALLAPASVALAACTTEEASAPATGAELTIPPPSTASPTTVATTTTTTTTIPPTSTTTTVAPTTTAFPGPQAPATGPAPLFAGRAGRAWLPLGGWNGTEFTSANAESAPVWLPGDEVRISTLGERPSSLTLGAPASACGSIEGPTLAVDLADPDPPGFGFGWIAVAGNWTLRPRPVAEVAADVAAYRAAARELLADDLTETAGGTIEQIVVADVDGDTDEEAIIVYGERDDSGGLTTGYSVLFVVATEDGTATELASSVALPPPPAPATTVPTPSPTDPAPGESTTTTTTTEPPPPPVLTRHRVLDVVDLNGDRVMEIVERAWTPFRSDVIVHTPVEGGYEAVTARSCTS